MGCFGSKEAKADGSHGSTELQTPNQQKTHGATGGHAQQSAVASSGAAAGTSSGGAGSRQLDRAVRDKSNPLVYFDMEQGGRFSSHCSIYVLLSFRAQPEEKAMCGREGVMHVYGICLAAFVSSVKRARRRVDKKHEERRTIEFKECLS